jgi:uncharacterized protein YdeI (YjbR/CyaY-like superfamily)
MIMENNDPRVDAYINKAADFARPILQHIRKLIHQAEPEIKETIKWGHVHFDLKSPVCYMAAFKKHCRFGFWHSALLPDPEGLLRGHGDDSGPLTQLSTLSDLPADEILLWYMRNAVDNNKRGIKPSKAPKAAVVKTALSIPDDFEDLLDANAAVKETFDAFSYSKRKEYLDWFADAKTEATRLKRMNTALGWIAEGKSRNWKYQ